MKNLSLILSSVLLVAVAVLYYLHFSSGSSRSTSSASVPVGELSIAYINSDSVLKNFDFLKDNMVVLEAKKKKMDAAP